MSFRLIALCVVVLVPALGLGGAAEAQLFSPKWSGFGGSPAQSRPMRLSRPVAGAFSLRGGMPLRALGRWSPLGGRSYQMRSGEAQDDWTGSYRTLCVRMCDGYYFPISYRATRGRMYRDAKICEASCDCETKLFYLPSSSSDIKHASDLSGQSYARLEKAFEYRQAWSQNCSCRPVPWSENEKIRHEQYAMNDTERHAEVQASKGEAIAGLMEREDAREAEAESLRIAKQEEKARQELVRMKEAVPAIAEALAKPVTEPEPEATAEALTEYPQGEMQVASTDGSRLETDPNGMTPVIEFPSSESQAGIRPVPRRGPVIAGRPAGRATRNLRASRPVKVSRPQSRGFWQM